MSSDEWYTPKYIFDALGCEFDLDVASPVDRTFCHVPAKRFYSSNSLSKLWFGFVWCNPPYSKDKTVWITKLEEHGNAIALLPDNTSAAWYQYATETSCAFMILSKRVKFVNQDGKVGIQPANGTTLFAYGERAVKALKRAQLMGLGILCKTA